MTRCPHPASGWPFRRRPSRFANTKDISPHAAAADADNHRPRNPAPGGPAARPRPTGSTGRRAPGPWFAVLMAGASAVGLLACSDSVWEPPVPRGQVQGDVAEFVPPTGPAADVDTLPEWKTVIWDMESPGCVFHFRRATGVYSSLEYKLQYSDAAKEASKDWWRPLMYTVQGVVTRPTADGGRETLPQHIGVRAVCVMPKSDGGTEEAVGGVEAILSAMGILDLGKDSADAASALAPAGEDRSWALAALGWFGSRLSPRPLSAAQKSCPVERAETGECAISVKGLYVYPGRAPISIGCGMGFDFDWGAARCRDTSLSPGPIKTFIPSGGGSSPGGDGDDGDGDDGGGDDGDGDGDDDGEDTQVTSPPLSLTCKSVPRGDEAWCRVERTDTTVTLSSLSYTWTLGSGVAGPSGTGVFEWRGIATSTRSMTVTVLGPGLAEPKTLHGTVTVEAREWASPARSEIEEPSYSAGGLAAGEWGAFTLSYGLKFNTRWGSGPWDGEAFVARSGSVTTSMIVHPDLRSENPLEYSTRDKTYLRTECRNDHERLLANESHDRVNRTCGTNSAWESWKTTVTDHEKQHQDNYNTCIASSAVTDQLDRLEALTGGAVTDNLSKYKTALENTIIRGALGQTHSVNPPRVWHARLESRWKLGGIRAITHGGSCVIEEDS